MPRVRSKRGLLHSSPHSTGIWQYEYNELRPHSVIGNRTRGSYAQATILVKAS